MNNEIAPHIHWVGAQDWSAREFHGYAIRRGTSYNSYLVVDEHPALIDGVNVPFFDDLKRHVSKILPLEKLAFIVVNHAEPDHAGALPLLVAQCPNAQVVCAPKCRDELAMLFDTSSWNFRTVSDGDELCLGKRTLKFFTTPMVHWPESMVTFLPEEKILFSMDAFGQHLASAAGRFDDEICLDEAMDEAKHYFANILMPFGMPIQKTLKRLALLSPAILAPSHGVLWRKNMGAILSAYETWARHTPSPKALILFDSMWGSTEKMARAMAEGASSVPGVQVKLLPIRHTPHSDIIAELLDAPCFALGSPCQNNTILPEVASLMTHLRGLRPTQKHALAFGAFGWNKKPVAEELAAFFNAIQATILQEPLLCQFTPKADVLKSCFDAGVALAQKAKDVAVS